VKQMFQTEVFVAAALRFLKRGLEGSFEFLADHFKPLPSCTSGGIRAAAPSSLPAPPWFPRSRRYRHPPLQYPFYGHGALFGPRPYAPYGKHTAGAALRTPW